MGIFQAALILATFLCSLVAGLLFALAVVVMPGISSLNDKNFVHAFQAMDGVSRFDCISFSTKKNCVIGL